METLTESEKYKIKEVLQALCNHDKYALKAGLTVKDYLIKECASCGKNLGRASSLEEFIEARAKHYILEKDF